MVSKLTRTLDSITNGSLVTPYLEEAILRQDWPAEYPIRVHNSKFHPWNNRFHPSSDIKANDLDLYYQKHPSYGPYLKKEIVTPSVIMAWQIGSALHAMLQSMMVHIGLTTVEECEVYFKEQKLGVSGSCDVRRAFLPSGQTPLIDIKTCSKMPIVADPSHVLQVQVYMDLLEEKPRDLGSVLYLEKSAPHKMKDFPVYPNPHALDNLYQKWIRVREAVENNDVSGLRCKCEGQVSAAHNGCPQRLEYENYFAALGK